MANWKTTLLVFTLWTIMELSGRATEKVSHRNKINRDKMARGAIGALFIAS